MKRARRDAEEEAGRVDADDDELRDVELHDVRVGAIDHALDRFVVFVQNPLAGVSVSWRWRGALHAEVSSEANPPTCSLASNGTH